MKNLFIALIAALTLTPSSHANVKNTNNAQVLVFEVDYKSDGGNVGYYHEVCKDELHDTNLARLELLKRHPDINENELEVRGAFHEIYGQPPEHPFPTGARCALQMTTFNPNYTLQISTSPVLDKKEECEPFLTENLKTKDVFWQQLRYGWSLFQGNWCYVTVVELERASNH